MLFSLVSLNIGWPASLVKTLSFREVFFYYEV
jgi:hypothetical protein